ncbi:MAG: RluA family pseudouridine synthase [bacterium]|nr:RluA family pseudouridine synthase [bacterium]
MNNTAHIESFEVSFKVEPHNSGLRLDEFMKAMLPRYSRNELHNIIDTRLVQKERRFKKGTKVRTGDEFFFLYDKKEKSIKDEDIPILFEDNHILIVNKPQGMLVHAKNPWGKNDLIQQLRRQRGSKELYLAHRIDRETSGIVLIARTREMAGKLGEAFIDRQVEKEYRAIVFGEVMDEAGIIDMPICGDDKAILRVKMMAGKGSDLSGAPSITEYQVIKRFEDFTLVKARPRTGRQHQIRVHFSAIGHPLVGDKIYKDEKLFLKFIDEGFTEELQRELLLPRQALHASMLSFKHPITGDDIKVEAEMPQDLRDFIDNHSN